MDGLQPTSALAYVCPRCPCPLAFRRRGGHGSRRRHTMQRIMAVCLLLAVSVRAGTQTERRNPQENQA